jgi:glycosyltransferase involved in cell wall biosynthesis
MVHPHDIFSLEEPWTVRIRELGMKMRGQGHEVKMVYFPLNYEETLKQDHLRFVMGYECIPLPRNRRYLIANCRALYELAEGMDIIHFQKSFPWSTVPSLAAAVLRDIPFHYDWDDWEYQIFNYEPPSRVIGWYLAFMEWILPRMVDTVSTASSRLRSLCHEYTMPLERIFPAPVGANPIDFNPEVDGQEFRELFVKDGLLVVYLGQLHGAQYVELFIQAADLLRNEEDLTFLIVGGGYRIGLLLEMVKSLGLEEKIYFTGYITHPKIPNFLAAADIAVACFEDNDITRCKSPLKIAEYMAMGKAIVASRVGEVSTMLDGSGVLVPPGDPEALAESILLLAQDPALRQSFGRKAHGRARTIYNWETTAQSLLKAYEVAIEGRQRV